MLTTSSFIVLGLVDILETATPYDLERVAELSVSHFWSIPHTQLYTECARLADAGYLDEEREQTGRRRRVYRLTEIGRAALAAWRAEPPEEPEEIRAPAVLKLFFGGDQGRLARGRVELHRRQLAAYEDLVTRAGQDPRRGRRAALEYGLAFERMALDFWSKLAEQDS
jgi:DNA-binding PadR family transcriptional regulator